MHILYPSLPYEPRSIDPLWEPEYTWVQAHSDCTVGLFDIETAQVWPRSFGTIAALYRGWMLTAAEYDSMRQAASLLISREQYLSSHLATGWYEAVREFTFPSFFTTASHLPDFSLGQRYFVKGLVKSFGAESVVRSVAEWQELGHKHEVAPDELLLVREFVELQPNSERRYFVVAGVAYGAGGARLPIQLQPALFSLHPRLFYSLDVALTAAGHPIIVEVGDGQVSDLKEWDVAELGHVVLSALAKATQP